jgi:hypothetical protein
MPPESLSGRGEKSQGLKVASSHAQHGLAGFFEL